jgi:rhodanese-related sulfurtransferase
MPIPAFYKFMGPTNTLGVPAMPELKVPALSFDDLAGQPADTRLVDVRPRVDQADGILPGALAIEVTTDFGSWAGWLVPREAPIVLIAGPDQDITEPVTQLAQIGVDTVAGVVRDMPADKASVGFELVDVERFSKLVAEPDAQVLDVRMPSEWASGTIDGSVQRFLPDLLTEGVPTELDKSRPVLVACRSGRRASIAGGILANEGYRAVVLGNDGVPEVIGQ